MEKSENTTNLQLKVVGKIDLTQFDPKKGKKRERIKGGWTKTTEREGENSVTPTLKVLGQIEQPEIKQENRTLQSQGSETKVLPNGMYEIDSSRKWQVGAVIFYDGAVNEFGMIAVKAKHASTYRFPKSVKLGNASLDRGDLVIFCVKEQKVVELIPIRNVSNPPWEMILRHVDFYKEIDFDYTIDRVRRTKGHMSVPVIETCLRHTKEAEELNMMGSFVQQRLRR